MAKMLPKSLNETSTRSDAEREFFALLRDTPGTEDWIVLHSLNLTSRGQKPYGEVDFVLLVPFGGVFALEVKGGRVGREAGEWHTINRYGERSSLKRSPFVQAQDGMWELRSRLKDALGERELLAVTFGSAGVFPDASLTVSTPEWAEFECLDDQALSRGLVMAIQRMIKGHQDRLGLGGKGAPSVELVGRIRNVLRPDFEAVVSASATLSLSEQRLVRLTEDQFGVLDLLDDNERLLCDGAAGTGKTMLALELAKREVLRGRKTLLVCYNKLLGAWMAAQTSGAFPSLIIGSFHQLAADTIKRTSFKASLDDADKASATFWRDEFPELAWQAIVELGAQFDTIIIDEGQDLASTASLDVFDAWLCGGLKDGRWAMFADFERQAIFADGGVGRELRETLLARSTHVARKALKMNCRNTKRIAKETALLSGFPKPPYQMGQVDGLPVNALFCIDDEAAATRLVETIKQHLQAGTAADDLVVLSPRRLDKSCAARVRNGFGFVLLDAHEAPPARSRLPIIRFATIQAFKGMESQAVIVCDLHSLSEGEPQSLLYVGLSRARLQLTLLLSSTTRPAYDGCRAKQFSPEWK